MSYILCSNENYYKPGEDLRDLFENLILQRIEGNLPAQAEKIKQAKTQKTLQVDIIHEFERQRRMISRGQAKFDEPFYDLSSEDRVLLYCVHYMPMHLYSSYHIFTKVLSLPVSDKVVFVDFGCGPLTAGIAFWAAAGKRDITYIGIDNSITMLNMAEKINQYGPYGSDKSSETFYKNNQLHLISDYNNELPQLLNSINMSNPTDTLIIFNFCYFLQSKTFEEPSNIEELSDLLWILGSGDERICMVYQDPVGDKFQGRWHNLKSWVITFPSMYDVSGFTWQDPTQVVQIKYDTLWGEQNPVDVSYDSFNNFSFLENYSNN